jgi:hypothetical protein
MLGHNGLPMRSQWEKHQKASKNIRKQGQHPSAGWSRISAWSLDNRTSCSMCRGLVVAHHGWDMMHMLLCSHLWGSPRFSPRERSRFKCGTMADWRNQHLSHIVFGGSFFLADADAIPWYPIKLVAKRLHHAETLNRQVTSWINCSEPPSATGELQELDLRIEKTEDLMGSYGHIYIYIYTFLSIYSFIYICLSIYSLYIYIWYTHSIIYICFFKMYG